ncbi:MAG: dienelactone hydrolase family protein [Candidatus Dactylopiibacterium sp.]|nr:dienelactone hydrolase family protein [Candidatus Dactylopiibacterium sp.]
MSRRLLASLLCGLGAVAAAQAQEAVQIPPAGLSTAPAPLPGFLFRAAGDGPHAAVVMLHGCGGAYAKDGGLNARHRMWGEFLAAHGIAALMLDSLTPRGERSLCTQKFADRKLRESDRRGDAYAALAWLRAQPGIAPQRIGLLGWSHGGGTTLDTIARAPRAGTGFASAVAFYPGCSKRAQRAEAYRPYAPLLIVMGEADDWTPFAPCRDLVAALAARGEAVRLLSYPDTYHDFDNPALRSRRVREEVPNGVNPGQGTTVAPNPAAREDAKRQVLAFFRQTLP